jgi:hypothetical protein
VLDIGLFIERIDGKHDQLIARAARAWPTAEGPPCVLRENQVPKCLIIPLGQKAHLSPIETG